ncbi:hypothetical protein KBTX_03272 [wastewater metagenome]|uniref:Sulfotransferase family n=2 Tax=unclassified sequences TaxID=12908 RepID=A0A5B8RD14_9ZZZZ|nr:sulfotransferase [Arhodomonas sp. KWT]QEA06929.1 hypothetical protein KBTEX_03272 [uncultured organism]
MFIFLMCSERSGSNLITKIMDAHHNVCGPSPKHLFNPVTRNAFRYEPLSDKGHWAELLTDIERLIGVSFSQWRTSFSQDDLLDLAPPGQLADLLRNIFLEEARAHGKQHCFVKENQLYEFTPFLLTHFPEARFLYLVRDPRDMALSWSRNPTHPGGVAHGAQQWKRDQQQFMKNHAALRDGGVSRMIRYEELVAATEEVTRSLCAFYGLPFDPGMLGFHENELTRRNAQTLPAWENLGKPVMSSNFGKYRDALSAEEIALIESICLPEMHALGYEPDTPEETLAKMSSDRIREALARENEAAPAAPEPEVRANMEAKRVFYQKRLGRLAT